MTILKKYSNSRKFELKNKDICILTFKISESLSKPIEIEKIYIVDKFIKDLDYWINNRVIPRERENRDIILESINLKNRILIDILKVNHACSLNDTLWIKEDGELNSQGTPLKWDDVMLYKGFEENIGEIAFFGIKKSLSNKIKTPEVTTNGRMAKAWRSIDGTIKLYKKGTSGGCNTGNEPYSEAIASKLLSFTDISHIFYNIDKWKNILCSVCNLFTSENIGYIPMKEVLPLELGNNVEWTYPRVLEVCKKYKVEEELKKMLFFDYLIVNQDRHFGNFGFTINNETREIVGFMPLFDHGYSLGNFMIDETEIDEKLKEQGTFSNTRLLDQGLAFSNEMFAKKMIKDIIENIEKLNKLDIPEERIKIAISILKKTSRIVSLRCKDNHLMMESYKKKREI